MNEYPVTQNQIDRIRSSSNVFISIILYSRLPPIWIRSHAMWCYV